MIKPSRLFILPKKNKHGSEYWSEAQIQEFAADTLRAEGWDCELEVWGVDIVAKRDSMNLLIEAKRGNTVKAAQAVGQVLFYLARWPIDGVSGVVLVPEEAAAGDEFRAVCQWCGVDLWVYRMPSREVRAVF